MLPINVWFDYLFKYDKKKKKECKDYFKMYRKYKKQLKQDAKDFSPWDHGYFIDTLSTMLHFYNDYYNQDYNVWQCKEDTVINENFTYTKYSDILKSLKECCRCVDILKDEYYAFRETIQKLDNETSEDYDKRCLKEYEKVQLDLFMTIARNYESWWD